MSSSLRRKNLILRAVAVIGVSSLCLSACSSDSGTESTGSAATTTAASAAGTTGVESSAGQNEPAAKARITIKGFAYGDPLTVAPGTEITVTNLDTAPHDVVPKDGDSWSMKVLDKDQSDTFKAPNTTGSYDFTCSIHPNMAGELIVS